MDVTIAMIMDYLREALLSLAFASPAILFVLFLVLALTRIPKVKKKEERPVKLIVFAVIDTYFACILIIEIVIIASLAAAVAHM